MSRAGFVSQSRAGSTKSRNDQARRQEEGLELVVVQRSGYLVSGPPRAKWFRCKGVEVEAYYVNQDRTPDRARNRR